MKPNRAGEQHIAVFGESGSGKTVLLSSFYGAMQEPQFLQKSLFNVVADDFGQGSRLHKNYLGMKNSAQRPETNRFSATSYSFSIKLRPGAGTQAKSARRFDPLRLVWHDYPGQWFEQSVSGPTEAQNRVEAFRSLLGSDVAILLVDGQKLLDNAGEEGRYLKSMLTNFRNGLLSLKDDLLPDGKPRVQFPRVWVMALSKSDLLPNLDVFKFRDLLIEKAGDDLAELRGALAELVDSSEALSVGEDFVLLSSAKFDPDKIEVTKRVGLDLVLPMAAILPFERHVKWAKAKQLPVKVAENLLSRAEYVAAALLGIKIKPGGPLGLLLSLASLILSKGVLDEAINLVGDRLKDANAEALVKHNFLTAMLTRFRIKLDEGEVARVLLRSPK